MPETGGVRKMRWRRQGTGKCGGVRVIYYLYNETLPIFMLNVFAKSAKANLSKAESKELKRLIPILVERYQR
ncbi:MAG: type II toxin-antitoxin system RelE/ParE family toxin [Bryobacteraceae bacterium]|nr:type II toxin-antitoxin system RelE/ParE family toxin [Bryobacteraceae bacterium]